jgi:sec-independent protein translocase protein TatB
MFDIGWSEMAVVALIAVLVIGPKELPNTLRMVGRWTRKAKSLTREFRSGFDEMIREAELEDVRKTVEAAKSSTIEKSVKDAIDPTGWVDKNLKDVAKVAKADPPSDASSSDDSASKDPSSGETPSNETVSGTDEQPAGDKIEANVIAHPTKIAPPDSLTPPPPAEAPQGGASAPEPSNEAVVSEDPAKSAREA